MLWQLYNKLDKLFIKKPAFFAGFYKYLEFAVNENIKKPGKIRASHLYYS